MIPGELLFFDFDHEDVYCRWRLYIAVDYDNVTYVECDEDDVLIVHTCTRSTMDIIEDVDKEYASVTRFK